MRYCENFRAILTADKDKDMLMARARCKMWSCAYCADVNRKQWRLRIYRASETLGEKWSFVTLTAHSKKRGDASLINLQEGWKKFSARMRREFGAFAYVRVYERHEDGAWHWHMLVNLHFEDIKIRHGKDGKQTPYSEWVARNARECGMGYYTHAENMRTIRGATKYITKYMTKSVDDLPRGIRRIQTSTHFPELVREAELDWQMKVGVWERDLWHVTERGGEIIDLGEKRALNWDDFTGNVIYPPNILDG